MEKQVLVDRFFKPKNHVQPRDVSTIPVPAVVSANKAVYIVLTKQQQATRKRGFYQKLKADDKLKITKCCRKRSRSSSQTLQK